MQRMFEFIKKEAVLSISFLAALISAFFIPPDIGYIEYIDFRVIILLFSLMSVVSGVQSCGVFASLAKRLCSGEKSLKTVIFILVLLPFFTSMLITNDVALITFVPFAILVLNAVKKENKIIFTVVMQTIAANLGSMATPVGNPQNLYLYNRYFENPGDFLKIVLPVTVVSLVLICFVLSFVKNEKVRFLSNGNESVRNKNEVVIWFALFFICLLSVFKILNEWILLVIILVATIIVNKKVLKNVDYSLLATFVFFFVFAGNIARVEVIKNSLENIMLTNAEVCALIVSQVISNVPAAVMLSNFTDNGTALLQYTNIGGLGTIIASLASLISFKYYLKTEGASAWKYLIIFTLFNILFLVVLCLVT